MLDGVVIDDTELFNDRLQEWEDNYYSTGHTEPSTDKPLTNGLEKSHGAHRCMQGPSVAHTFVISLSSQDRWRSYSWTPTSRKPRRCLGFLW